jgi:hypothetical protein
VPQLDGAGSWISKKVAKPSLDSIGNWLSGGLTKLIAGDGEELGSAPIEPSTKTESGAFSHYSSISSTNTSQTPSPNASVVALPLQPGVAPPRRAGSAMSQRPGSAAAHRNGIHHHPTDRSASAMDYLRPPANKGSPAVPPHAFSANAATTTFYQADIGYRAGQEVNRPEVDTSVATATYSPWWGADESSGPTPTAATFYQVNEALADASGGGDETGFISPMDTFSPMPSPVPMASSSFTSTPQRVVEEDELEDLGLSNSKGKKVENADDGDKEEEKKEKEAEEPKKEVSAKEAPKPTGESLICPSCGIRGLIEATEVKHSSSWLGRWWTKKEADTPGPVKANLGEQMSLVYDKELKRWVNPNVSSAVFFALPQV